LTGWGREGARECLSSKGFKPVDPVNPVRQVFFKALGQTGSTGLTGQGQRERPKNLQLLSRQNLERHKLKRKDSE
jgi:hypothetical protein